MNLVDAFFEGFVVISGMTSEELFAMEFLGLSDPWIVTGSSIEDGELHIKVDFNRGSRFDGLAVHDSVDRSWRHLNFWQYPTYIHARVPRVIERGRQGVAGRGSWARPGSGFTALFEALADHDVPPHAGQPGRQGAWNGRHVFVAFA